MESGAKRLYRAATRYPPPDREYGPPAGQGRQLPANASEEQRRSWDALSAWDTLEAAMHVARGSVSARYVVCFDIPEDRGIVYEQTGEPGHFDIRGNIEELKRLLSDERFDVERGSD